MAKRVGLSQSAIVRIWQAFELEAPFAQDFQVYTDQYFVEKVRDVVGLYLSPPDLVIVLSVDEKSKRFKALDRTQPLLPMTPGQAETGAPTITFATARPRSSPPRMLPRAKSSASATASIDNRNL